MRAAPTPSLSSRAQSQRGISLIEMMVGVAIGILCVLVILQLLTAWESRKRTATSGSGAQMSGTLAQFTLDRDLRLAGYGFGTATNDVMGCTVGAFNTERSAGNSFNFALRPVQITKGADDGPDEIRVLYGNSAYFVASQPVTGAAAITKTLKSREGFNLGDRVLMTGNTPMNCELLEVTGYSIADTFTIEHEAGKTYIGAGGVAKNSTMNKVGGTGTLFTKGRVFNLGPSPVLSVWKANPLTGTLSRFNWLNEDDTGAVEVSSDVVSLKAQYGIDANANGMVEVGEWTDTTTAATDWTKVLAVRFAILVRSKQFERPVTNGGVSTAVTPTAPTWANGAFVLKNVDQTADSGSSAIAGAAAANNWRNYRYRVYEGIVPLRNMIWGTAP
ncbi:conserved hypothetical protein [Burkholderiales bacterium 8X]|nr:conserved hypothetical protein [Burkholderiales bacterium 8X]